MNKQTVENVKNIAGTLFLSLLISGTILNFISTCKGLIGILGSNRGEIHIVIYLTSFVITIMSLSLNLNTLNIWTNYYDDIYRWLRPIYIINIIFSIYLNFIGTSTDIVLGKYQNTVLKIGFNLIWQEINFVQKINSILITFLIVIIPILFSLCFIYSEENK
ncbi:MAG TPA: hypothetical protein V6C58_07115 [Allocoleopsis sp.]